jgi:hypothetical protein
MKAFLKELIGGAFGAGLVLIVLPSVALYFGLNKISQYSMVGLPILAIFGIMMLFGALALIAAVFEKLGLADKTQALALPDGSIRAVIALSLIVLFAIISIMLYRSLSDGYDIPSLDRTARDSILKDTSNRVAAVRFDRCAQPPTPTPAPLAATAPSPEPAASDTSPNLTAAKTVIDPPSETDCSETNKRFVVSIRSAPGQEADLAKQLLILVGTLMTAVTSFYFAQRGPSLPTDNAARNPPNPNSVSPSAVTFTPKQPFHLTISGSNLDDVRKVRLSSQASAIEAVDVEATKDKIDCSFIAADNLPNGIWTVLLTDSAGKTVSPKNTVTLTRAA